MDKIKVFKYIKQSPKNVKFSTICKAAEAFGFKYRGGKGSHRIYVKPRVYELLNFQNVHGIVKHYQVKQFIKIIEKYNLLEKESK